MTDLKTLKVYEDGANSYAEDWLSQPPPDDMYELLKKYFIKGGPTADVGCGNGREPPGSTEMGIPASALSQLLRSKTWLKFISPS